ncbi:cytochrome P450 CYP736A12-like isoform X2 [Neltuma alba]|uniref:cytochrome P450 CYP736A12-like isoform X2 n=1 Tax=Neltuma alba TaxID=207710 RepID=UPI0010A42DE7|nr:cytochrome P450 CYP736A12-like isoform X2 [Prosopis alba]XP_028792254.1 cytochrome P450 CYP736A12-like isoform X2 [Prosopis alba]
MIPSTLAIPAIFLLTLIYALTIFLRPNKIAQKRPPGPLALPIIGNLHLLGTLPHRNLQSLANKYGPIMYLRLGQIPTIVVSSPEAAELFLKTYDPVFANRIHTQATDYLFYGSKGVAFSEYGSYWRDMKKLSIQHLFSASNHELFGHLRGKELRIMVKSLENAATMGGVVDISEKVHGLLEDIVYMMILGRNKDDQFDLKLLISEALRLAGAFNLADVVPWLGAFDLQGLRHRCKEISKALDQLFEKIIKEHEEARNSHKDGKNEDYIDILLSLMHQPMDDEQTHQITRDDIKANILSLISGAYETSAISVEWTLSELCRNPRVMKNLQDELEIVVGMNRMVEEMDLSELNYLNLVVKENFRLHPVTPFIPRASAKDVMVGEYYIEKKSRILVNLWGLGRNPQIWSDNADVFYPERFLNNNIDLQGHDFQFLPFGSGRRKCFGMQLGQTTVKLVVAQLAHCFNWELPSGMKPDDLDMNESFGLSLPRSKHLLVELTRRLSSKVYDYGEHDI